jgi:hypothetical protein
MFQFSLRFACSRVAAIHGRGLWCLSAVYRNMGFFWHGGAPAAGTASLTSDVPLEPLVSRADDAVVERWLFCLPAERSLSLQPPSSFSYVSFVVCSVIFFVMICKNSKPYPASLQALL